MRKIPESIDEIPKFYSCNNESTWKIIGIFDLLFELKRFDLAEAFICLAQAQFTSAYWPIANLISVYVVQGKKIEAMKLSSRVLKLAKGLPEKKLSDLCLWLYGAAKKPYQCQHFEVVDFLSDLAMRVQPYGKKVVLSSNRYAPLKQLVEKYLARLRQTYKFKLISFYTDAWDGPQSGAMYQSGLIVDACHHTHSSFLEHVPDDLKQKTLCFPCPYPRKLFHHPDVSRDVFAAFFGTLHNIRVPWLSRIEKEELSVEIRLSNHDISNELSSMEAYAREMSRYNVSVIFSARNTYQTTITGAVWEALLTGSLIMEERSEEVSDYLLPFVHYIPFESYAQMAAYLDYLKNDQDLVDLIKSNADDLFDRYYKPENFWSALFSIADQQENE